MLIAQRILSIFVYVFVSDSGILLSVAPITIYRARYYLINQLLLSCGGCVGLLIGINQYTYTYRVNIPCVSNYHIIYL